MVKVVFAGSPDFAVDSLISLYENSNISIPLVISQKDKKRNRGKFLPTDVKEKANSLGIEVITPENINDDHVYEMLSRIDPDFIVVVAYGQLIGSRLLKKFNNRIINVHSSILPHYRGAAPINWAIINGDQETGISIMLMDKGLDTGDILKIEKTFIEPDETSQGLHDRLKVMGGKNIVDVINNFKFYYDNRIVQGENGSYCGKLYKEMGRIVFSDNPITIYNKFRGLNPWPGSFFYLEDRLIRVHKMYTIIEYNGQNDMGRVISVTKDGIKVKVRDGFIVFQEIQFPNKKRMSVESFLLGNSFPENAILK